MEAPLIWFILLIALGIVLLALSFLVRGEQTPPVMTSSSMEVIVPQSHSTPLYLNGEEIVLPEIWNDYEIEKGIQRYKQRPNFLLHYINAVIDRFILGQDLKMVERRTMFIEVKMKEFQAVYDFVVLTAQLKRLRLQEELKDVELQTLKDEAIAKRDSQAEIRQAQRDLEKKKLQLELAKVEKEIKGLTESADPAEKPKPTAKEIRQRILQEVQELDAEMQRYLVQIAKGRQYDELPPAEQEHYDRIRNTYNNLIDKKYEELERT